ncbi:MAG TPA: hypothetical protein VNA16_07915, partial [Abditibacteriaceae bacterium]|nr:hypothetical protein [Abditibacteriaceae bacterium]
MPAYKKLLKIPQRAALATRGEWSMLLATALCALLAMSPAVGAPLAASSLTVSSFTASSTPVSEAMLWWLGNQLSGQQSTPSALYRGLMPSSADPHEVAALLTALEYTTSVYPDGSAGDCRIMGAR